MPASFVTCAGLDENNTFTGACTFSGAVTFTGTTVDEGAQAIAPAASTSGAPTVPLTVTAAVDLAMTASTEAPSVYLNLAASRQFATGALTTQRAFRIAAPTYRFVGASTLANAATVYIDAAPAAGTNATITNSYALWVDAGRVRFDGAVVLNDYPVVSSTTVLTGSPAVNTPCGVVQIDSGATTVTVTAAAVTANSIIVGSIRNATSNACYLRSIVPGAGSFVVTVSADPGASHAQIAFAVLQPGAGV
jgi:hypothetical protein